jgi:hypothetical protein
MIESQPEDLDPFVDFGKEDRFRKPQKLTGKQLAVMAAGLAIMVVGGLTVGIGFPLGLLMHSRRTANGAIVVGGGICLLGYTVYRKHWAYRRK